MQTLGLAAGLFGSVHAGTKHVTVRKGRVAVSPGPMTFRGHGKEETVVVTHVHYTTVRRMLPAEYRGDGAVSAADLLKGLKRFYPGLKMDDEVTVITFKRPESK